MFKSIEIDNFKSFGSKTKVELAPITLILGQNSAGKSSLLHALTLLKQTREGRDVGAPLLPRAEDGIIDLGSFHELLFEAKRRCWGVRHSIDCLGYLTGSSSRRRPTFIDPASEDNLALVMQFRDLPDA